MSWTNWTWRLATVGSLSLGLFAPRNADAHWRPPVEHRIVNIHKNVADYNNHVDNNLSVIKIDKRKNEVVVRRDVTHRGHEMVVVIPRPGDALYILSVGVNCNRTQPGKPPDDHAPFARAVASLLQKHSHDLYGNVHARVLTGKGATRKSILGGFDWLRHNARAGDVTVVFLSSHGGYGNGNYLMAPAKTGARDWKQDVVWGQEIREALLEIPGRKIMFLNTCSAAGILQAPGNSGALPNTEIICCTRAHEGFGPTFAMDRALVHGLEGAAADRNGVVTLGSLERYVQGHVKKVTRDREHVTIAHPRRMTANYGQSATSLASLPLGMK